MIIIVVVMGLIVAVDIAQIVTETIVVTEDTKCKDAIAMVTHPVLTEDAM